MQNKGQKNPLRIISTKNLTDPSQKCEFLEKESIIGVVSELGLEIYRVKPQFERIALISSSELNNSNIRDFILDPIGQLVIISTDKPKVQVFKLTEDEDRRPYIIFNDADNPVLGLKIIKTKYHVKGSYHNFQRITDTETYTPETTYSVAEKIFKSSFTHLFTIKENLNKIQKLESLIDKNNQIYILYSIDGKKIKASLNSLIDLFTLDLTNYIDNQDFEILSIHGSNCLKKLNLFINTTNINGHNDVVSVSLGFKQLSENIDEFFCLNYSLALVKEFLLNLKLGFFNAKTKFKEIGKRVQAFLGELNIEEQENIDELRWFIKLGLKATENLPSFFEILDMKKLAEFHQFVLQNFSIVEDFVSESLKPGLSKILVILEDTKRVILTLNIQSDNLIELESLEAFISTVKLLSVSINRLFFRISAKKLELLNFFLFLFKWKMKSSANLKYTENPEYLKYHNALLDFKLLLQYLSSQSSICLDDLSAACETEILVYNTEESFNTQLDSALAENFNSLYLKLGLVNDDLIAQNKNNAIVIESGECIRDLFRKVDSGFTALNRSLKNSFLNSVVKLDVSLLLNDLQSPHMRTFPHNNTISLLSLDKSNEIMHIVKNENDHLRLKTFKLPQGLSNLISNFEINTANNELIFSVFNRLDNNYHMKYVSLGSFDELSKNDDAEFKSQLKRDHVVVNEQDVRFKTEFAFKGMNSIRFNQNFTWLVVKENQLSILE